MAITTGETLPEEIARAGMSRSWHRNAVDHGLTEEPWRVKLKIVRQSTGPISLGKFEVRAGICCEKSHMIVDHIRMRCGS